MKQPFFEITVLHACDYVLLLHGFCLSFFLQHEIIFPIEEYTSLKEVRVNVHVHVHMCMYIYTCIYVALDGSED